MRSTNLLALAAAVCTALAAAPLDAAADALPAGTLHVERAMIIDATGFEAPLAASTLFLPSGWRTSGGVVWGQQHMCTNGYNFEWSATSPDGRATIAVLPQRRWETNNYGAAPSTPGCSAAPYTTARQYLEAVAQSWKPGARVLDFRAREDLMRNYTQFNKVTPMPLGESRSWADAGEVLFSFNEGGADMRGSIAAVVLFSLSRTASPGLPQMDALSGYALPAYGVTAPNGELKLPFFEAIRKTIKENPQWTQRIGNHNNAINRVAMQEAQKRSQIMRETNAEIAKIREEAWNSYQESSDRRVREFGELIRGVETYNDSDAPGGTVQLSSTYNNAWRLNDGSYVLTDDSSFEPYRALGIEGRKLEVTQ